MGRAAEDAGEDVDDVFALLVCSCKVGAGAGGEEGDEDGVDVAC